MVPPSYRILKLIASTFSIWSSSPSFLGMALTKLYTTKKCWSSVSLWGTSWADNNYTRGHNYESDYGRPCLNQSPWLYSPRLSLAKFLIMDIHNGWANRVTDFVLITKKSSHTSVLVLILDRAILSVHARQHASFTSLRHISNAQTFLNMHIRWRRARQAQILDAIRHVLLLQHPSDLDKVIIHKNANLSTSLMGYSSGHFLHWVTVALSAASAILILSERWVVAVKSGSLRCASEFK